MSQTGKETRCLGLIGGLGPSATVHYYRELLAVCAKHGRVPRLLIAHADVDHAYATVSAKDYEALARYLAGLTANLAAGGAEFTAIVAATSHICAPQLTTLSPLPLVNMLTEVAERHVRAASSAWRCSARASPLKRACSAAWAISR